ncbi:MAG: alpha-1,4-glucan--maltose-1-phosphate maltosyltransferase [Pirellulaceae bacterium]
MDPLPAGVPSRVLIEGVAPEIDGGRFPIKRAVGDAIEVQADIHTDGHEVLGAVLRYRAAAGEWTEIAMRPLANDRWSASFVAQSAGWHEYTLLAWIDRFATWRRDLVKKAEAGQDVSAELLEGAEMVRQTAERAGQPDGDWLRGQADRFSQGDRESALAAALDPILSTLAARHADRSWGVAYDHVLRLWVDRERARYGAWYELFPRSCADEPGRHGTFRDVEARLPYVAAMGFDVLYLPPIHPIGRAYRKGPNNTLTAAPTDPGSPWAIGSSEGGHKAIHPELGTLADFHKLLSATKTHGLEIALDIAFQCSPDHPYVREHPEWFRRRPDGSIRYAENPPKKYQDIYPLDFECADWQCLWQELLSVVLYWAEQGVRIFRVDNPHTKPFRFWQWLIAGVQERYPDAIFLSEAFTRPKVMKFLAKSGFSQSYTYFTWRNTKWDLTEYFTELTQTDVRHYLRPNLFANTPDILPEFLQHGGPAAFQMRLILAATLGATYGIYGPPYENFEATPRPGSEEYIDSEKFQLRHWDWSRPNVFCEFIARVNQARRENPALQHDHRLRFHLADNDQLLFYSKTTADLANIILVVVNVDPYHMQSGYVHVPLAEFGLTPGDTYQVQDLLTGAHFLWQGSANYISLDPQNATAHVLRLRKKARTEQDFDYFM